MRFKNDNQRKAIFANMGNTFARDPRVVKIETPTGTILAKEDFIKEMGTATIRRIPKKKGIVEIIKEEGGVPQVFDPVQSDEFARKSKNLTALELAKMTYDNLWNNPNMSPEEAEKATYGYLKELEASGDPILKKWASGEIDNRKSYKRVQREEAKFEDASKGRDPDALRSEEDLKAEIESEYDEYYRDHARDDE